MSSVCWNERRDTRGWVMRDEASNCLAAKMVGMGMPSPPSCTGSASALLSASLMHAWQLSQ